jgi:NADH:ubiquinone oxidoreductase subunit 6 (subunit J)
MNSAWVLWLFEGIAIGAALMILFSKSVFHAALNLLVTSICLGVIFGMYGSEFLFITQIMIYGGGILVLILFATMVSSRGKSVTTEVHGTLSIPVLLASAGVIVIAATYVDYGSPKGIPMIVPTQQLGVNLLIDYALPLEISGILLLASLVGAAIVTMQKPTQA